MDAADEGPVSRTLERFGKISEGKLARWYGEECWETIGLCAAGLDIPVPIFGAPASVWRGGVIPRMAGGGFASLSDLISEATVGGKTQTRHYNKTGVAAAAVGNSQSMWAVGTLPAAGANAAAAPGGTVPTNASTGALGQSDAAGAETLHLTTWTGAPSQVGSLMLYDYLFGVNINHATTANTVTGTQTRYTGAAGTPEYAAGNFLTGRVTTVLAATAHNITATYADQDNNAGASSGAIAVRVSSAVNTMPLTQPRWNLDLAAGDTGYRQVTSLALSAASTGNVDWFIGHPIAILPEPVVNVGYLLDGINSAFNLVKVQNGACLALMEFFKSATAARTSSGLIQLVSG
jgi:hypothetical protein